MTVPFPVLETDSVTTLMAKFAVHFLFAFIVTTLSVQSVFPVQPVNLEFAPGIGVKVTALPFA